MKKLAEKTFYVGNMTDEEGEQFKAKAEALLAKELTEYEFTVSIAYLEGEEPTVVAEIEKGDMRGDKELDERINNIVRVDNLQELTGKESGIIVYDDGTAIVDNWSGTFLGIPGIFEAKRIERVKPKKGQIERYVDKDKVTSNDNNDELVGDATIYKLPGDIIVIAPKGWN